MRDFYNEIGKTPDVLGDNPGERNLGKSLNHVRQNYITHKGTMINPEVREVYEDFLLKFPEFIPNLLNTSNNKQMHPRGIGTIREIDIPVKYI